MSDVALDVKSLGKSYRIGFHKERRQALNGLSFTLPAGKVMGLLGPNGAGKTTTLKIIMDFLVPDEGEVRIFGDDWREPRARQRMGFLPEQPYFYYYLTPNRILRYLGRLMYMPDPEIDVRVSHLLSLVGLSRERDLALSRFSKGMLQRLGIAQALLNQPSLLILDEPSTGLDPLGKMEVRKILQDTSEQGTTILLSSHQLSEVEEICDHLCIIDRGREVAQGSISDLLGREETYQVTLDGEEELEAEKLELLGARKTEGAPGFIVPRPNLDLFLRELSTKPARILEVKPRRITLEEYFLAHVSSRRERE